MSKQHTWVYMNPNSILKSKDESFYISYNPGDYTISAFSFDTGGDETALVREGKYYILNGDHRDKYEKRIDKGFSVCLDYFDKNGRSRSSWSN